MINALVCKVVELTNVDVGVRELPPHGGLLQVEGVKLLVYVAQQVRLHQHLANDAKQPHEAHRGTNCKSKQQFQFSVLVLTLFFPGWQGRPGGTSVKGWDRFRDLAEEGND